MQLFKKQKAFFDLFTAFLKSASNLEYFEKKKKKKNDDPNRSCISETTDCQRCG